MRPDPDRPARLLGAILLVLLAGLGPALAFSAGSYFPRSWLPALLFMAGLAAVVLLFGLRPRLQTPGALLLLVFAAQLGWTALSLSWARSPANAWEEVNRSALFGLAVLLALLAVTYLGRRGHFWLSLAVLGAVTVVAATVIFRLTTVEEPIRLFTGGRLHYPVTYWNGLSALLMIGFWLALTLASARNLAPWLPPLLVATATILAQLALLPQSRGGLWTFFLVAPWFVLLSPHRFRALFHLGVVLGAVALGWAGLTDLYTAAAPNEGLTAAIYEALGILVLSALGVVAASGAGQLVERLLTPLPRRVVLWGGAGLIIFGLLATAAGVSAANRTLEGGLGGLADRTWQQLRSDAGPQETLERGHRFSDVGLSGRLQQWRISWQAFEERPLLGLGAQNFEPYYYEHRTSDLQVKQPHSQPMQLLAELGLPGAALWLLFFAGAIANGVGARFRARRPENQAAAAALVLGSLSWFIHSSADWLWQLAGVSWPAILLLGGLISLPGFRARAIATESAPQRISEADSGRLPPRRTFPTLRIVGIAAAAVIFLSALFPYLSLRYGELAYGLAATDLSASLAAADRAAQLDRLSPAPLVARAYILGSEAAAGAGTTGTAGDTDTLGRTLDLLGLRLLALEEARTREPVSWSLALQTGEAALEYRQAAMAAGEEGSATQQATAADEEKEATILKDGEDDLAALRLLQTQGPEQLTERARGHLEDARRLNPRQPEIQEKLAGLE